MNIPIFILHGWAIDPRNDQKWQPVISGLEKSGYTVTFLSLPGFAESVETAWTVQDYILWIKDQMKKFPQVILVGHSFGGQLAVRYSRTYPEQVSRLILIDSSGIRPFTLKARVKRAIFQSIAKAGKILMPFEQARIILHRLAKEKDYLEASPIMRETMKNVLADEVLDDLPDIKVKTLILWGENDKATPVSHARLFERGISGSVLELIPDARHSPQFTHPDVIVEKIVKFLKQTSEQK